MHDPVDVGWMRRALELAERGRHTVSPNPLVGCVLVAGGDVVGEGWHQRAGQAHAEVLALAEAGERARGAVAYVTLEPCAHTGRTGPCADALVAAGVSRVVAALADPHPLAAGGARRLRAAGVDVALGVCEDEARAQNEVFLHGVATGRPFVTLKCAVSVDGRIAAADGTSQWLTGPAARSLAHELRARADAVVVGSGTVLADDPALTVRLPGYAGPQPLRVVLDGRARTSASHRVLDGEAPVLVGVRPEAEGGAADKLRDAGAQVVALPRDADGGLGALLDELWRREVRSVLVEGGARVLGAFLGAGLWDRLVVHVAALLLGEAGRPALVGDGIATLAGAPRLRLERVEQAGDDVVCTYRPGRQEG
ncbi:MAG TPA: bifunctional diaminohydroxyphosphoribosylaminopyrimidine deaminase/5-amino-6-(5-phosphoribosylamino)uracil reductase RibD [Egibacteraceae bacterium]|nr:bifunctional diaminohydroxyphosphoribosylaminopyrimidine deaminase/5-amino-6-(5-phosphoribosylamino)uracil reductase RibD [Egibacteraceae bacterium]